MTNASRAAIVTPMPHFVVHTLAQATAALQAAAEAKAAVTLWSPPGAVHSLGTGYFLTMIAAARRQIPEADAQAVLDCGEASGLALAALRAGATAIHLAAAEPLLAKVADIAAQHGARLEPAVPGTALDLARCADPLAAARTALARP